MGYADLIIFRPDLRKLSPLPAGSLRKEVNFCGCSLAFALAHAGPTLQRVLRAVEGHLVVPDGYTATVTAKVAWGTPWPRMTLAKPGWHWDGYVHTEGKPDFRYDPRVRHYVANIVEDPENGPVASTEVAVQSIAIEGLDPYRELRVAMRGTRTVEFEANTLYAFDQQTIHRSGLVVRPGWRQFVRVSVSKREPIDAIDTAPVQVYVDLQDADHGS